MQDDVFNATLISRDDLNEELSIVRVRPDGGLVPQFKPGQFCTLGWPRQACAPPWQPKAGTIATETPLANRGDAAETAHPRMIRRAYSIASSADQRDAVELLVVLVEKGRLTPRLWTIGVGGRIWMDSRIMGEFTLDDVPPEKDLVMVSTGTGLAPFMSMLRTYRGQQRWRRLVIIHGVRRERDLAYRQELEQVCRQDRSVTYLPIVSREPEDSGWSGLRGRVQTILGDQARYLRLVGWPLDPQRCHVFLCGNPAMIQSVEALLHDRGFVTHTRRTPGNIHFERYW